MPGPPGWETVPVELGEPSPQSIVAVKSAIFPLGFPSTNVATGSVNGILSVTSTAGWEGVAGAVRRR